MCVSVFSATCQDRLEFLAKFNPYRRGSASCPSVWPYLFSSNKIEILLILPENESHEQKVTYFLTDSVVFAQKTNSEESSLDD
jgi:hypothetical protein